MGIERTASSRQIDLGMQKQWFLSILQHKMQKTKLPYFSLYFLADSFENLKCPAIAHFLTENSEIFSGSLFLITTGLVNSPWWNSTKLQILDTLMDRTLRGYSRCWVRKLGLMSIICAKNLRSNWKIQDLKIRKFATHSTLRARGSGPKNFLT